MTTTAADEQMTFRAMATDVTVRVVDPGPGASAALGRAREVFERVESACTRFDPSSPLMRANAAPDRWHDVPAECADAVAEAARAYQDTDGVFDPRVLDDLVGLGYDRTLPFADGPVRRTAASKDLAPATAEVGATSIRRAQRRPQRRFEGRPPWRPRIDRDGSRHRVHLSGARIDLGGIGKGLAVRWASRELAGAGRSSLVEAGGDTQLTGTGPAGAGWLVGLEDPLGSPDPLAVFALTDTGCATSSTRVRRWMIDGREVHHIIDPRTGLSGGAGLASVTVIQADVAWAEVWSKTLFLSSATRIAQLADVQNLAAAWVTVDGTLHVSAAAKSFLVWEASHG